MHTQVASWRKDEEKFYRSVLNDTQLYMGAMQLVRLIVDSLEHDTDVDSLVSHYKQIDSSYVNPIAKTLDLPQLVLLNYDLALSSGFYIRWREILESQALAETEVLVAKARKNGEEWVVIYDNETERSGYSFFERLEMHLPDGISLRIASDLDLEKGRIFSVEPMVLDLKTGRIRQDSSPSDTRKEFTTKEALMVEVGRLRTKYSKTT